MPPPDVAWVWLVHQLAPERYAEDTTKLLGGEIAKPRPLSAWLRGHDGRSDAAALQVGSHVEVKYEGSWYPGRLDAADADGNWTVLYDDGSTQSSVHPGRVRPGAVTRVSQEEAASKLREQFIERLASGLLYTSEEYAHSQTLWEAFCAEVGVSEPIQPYALPWAPVSPASVQPAAAPSGTTGFISTMGYNLEAAVERQRVFNYQVSLPHYRERVFLVRAVQVSRWHSNCVLVLVSRWHSACSSRWK